MTVYIILQPTSNANEIETFLYLEKYVFFYPCWLVYNFNIDCWKSVSIAIVHYFSITCKLYHKVFNILLGVLELVKDALGGPFRNEDVEVCLIDINNSLSRILRFLAFCHQELLWYEYSINLSRAQYHQIPCKKVYLWIP